MDVWTKAPVKSAMAQTARDAASVSGQSEATARRGALYISIIDFPSYTSSLVARGPNATKPGADPYAVKGGLL